MRFASLLKRRSLLAMVLGGFCLLLPGCLEFEKSWAAALESAKEKQGKFESMEGPWEGSWKSDSNGHTGKLRCIVTSQEDGEYEFHYWAQWQVVLSGSYKAKYKTEVKGDKRSFQGDMDLGKLGGVYKHTGEATKDSFTAKYSSDQGDKGTFEMKRPKPKAAVPEPEPEGEGGSK